MRHALLVVLALMAIAVPPARAQDPTTMPLAALERTITDQHPSAYFILAIRKFEAGDRDEAVRWLYIGQIRWRFHIAANPDLPPDGDGALLASFMETIGRPINEYSGGDHAGWLAAMDAALAWDAANPNGFTDKQRYATELRTTRRGLEELRRSMEGRKEELMRERTRNGLENRTR